MNRTNERTNLASPFFDVIIVPLMVCLSIATCFGCRQEVGNGDDVIATTNEGPVTAVEFDSWLASRKISKPPVDPLDEIRQMVVVRGLAESAINHGLDKDPTIEFRLRNAEDLVLAAAMKRHIAESATVSSEEIDEALEANPLAFHKPKRVRLRNLFKRFPSDASAAERREIRRQMEELRRRLVAGADMAELALAESDSETRYRKGLMGTFDEGQLPPALDSMAMSMTEGEISEIQESADGLTILMCDGIFEATTPGIEEARTKVEKALLTPKRKQALDENESALLENASLSIDFDLLMNRTGPPDEVVAEFGGHTLTRAGFDEITAARRRRAPNRKPDEAQVRAIVETQVITTTAAARARELGLADAPLKSTIRMRQDTILATVELARRVRLRLVNPTEAEVREYFETHRAEFQQPEEFDLMIIRMTFSTETLREVHTQAGLALESIDSGRLDFEEARRRYSDPESLNSSLIRTSTAAQMAGFGSAFAKAIQSLRAGQVSRLIRQENQFWIVKLLDTRPARRLDFDEAATIAKRRLGQLRVDQLGAEIEAAIIAAQDVRLVSSDRG